MPTYTRTSRSLLRDRHVRVFRQEKIDDGMGGTYLDFTLIIERYWCRIAPDQHTLRSRVELGDQEARNAYTAIADPSHNGKTIRVGDRFHDVQNNQCYDVVAVRRPRPGLSYGAMVTFELRIVKDGCPEEAVPYATSAPPGGASAQTHFIMRHFGGAEILDWASQSYFDGAVYNLQYDDPDQIAALAAMVAAGKRWWRYYSVLDYPFSGTVFSGTTPPLATWFNFLRDNIQFSGSTSHRRFRVADTVSLFNADPAGVPPEQRELIPWGLITGPERAAIVAQMVALADAPGGTSIPAAGVFLDQSWLNLPDFFVEDTLTNVSGHGDVKEGSPKLTALDYAGTEAAFGDGGLWTTHRAAILSLYDEVDAALGPTRYALKNGDHRIVSGDEIPKPWMFENAWNNNIDGANQPDRWASAKAGFLTDPRNLLSILCSAAPNSTVGVPEALAHWQTNGGWIGFTSDGSPQGIANEQTAYAEAAAILASMGVG